MLRSWWNIQNTNTNQTLNEQSITIDVIRYWWNSHIRTITKEMALRSLYYILLFML